jgi:hypothetical protein
MPENTPEDAHVKLELPPDIVYPFATDAMQVCNVVFPVQLCETPIASGMFPVQVFPRQVGADAVANSLAAEEAGFV